MRILSAFFLPAIMAFSISGCNTSQAIIEDEEAYVQDIQEWQQSRLERLKGKGGWLNLAGLFWLEEGENSFGSDPDNDIVFPEKADCFCGTLSLEGGRVKLNVAKGTEITSNGAKVTSLELKDDHEKVYTLLEQGDFAWFIIQRGDRYGIRLRDYRHPRIAEMDHIPAYPINPAYVVEASLVPLSEPKTFTVETPVEGVTESYQCPGELHFRINKKDLVLYPFTSGKEYFLVIADETTGLETYGAGRFMYCRPDSTGRILLDFNKAYNPPCAFSPYATCPMPPRENFLAISIEAGEKAVHLHAIEKASPASTKVVSQPEDKELLEQLFALHSEDQETPISELMVDVGAFFTATPYVAHTLEGETEELVVNLREFDCTTFVESCLAISRSIKSGDPDFELFVSELIKIRYRSGEVNGYTSRIHYFSDWIHTNNQKQIVKDVSVEIGGIPFPGLVNFMSTHPGSYRQLVADTNLIRIIAKQEAKISAREMFYISTAHIKDVEPLLMDGDIVGFTSGIGGLDISHVGILIRKSGRIHLMHASSRSKKVVIAEKPLEEYLKSSKTATGIMVARPQ